jgi:Cof subfamily protein (haloacid dehalogenase superfamily)
MAYKLVACDYDETLIPHPRVVGEHAVNTIREAVGRGVKFVLATGRNLPPVSPTLKELGVGGRDDQYVILLNGCLVSTCSGKVIASECMDHADAEAVYAAGRERGFCMQVNAIDKTFVTGGAPEMRKRIMSEDPDMIEMDEPDLAFLSNTPIAKVLILHDGEDYLRKVAASMPELQEHLDVTYSSDCCLEYIPRGVSKGTGLRHLCDYLGIDIGETMAIGDSSNDFEILEAAGLGVGVANVTEAARPACDYVCEHEADEGVAEAIERFVLRPEPTHKGPHRPVRI